MLGAGFVKVEMRPSFVVECGVPVRGRERFRRPAAAGDVLLVPLLAVLLIGCSPARGTIGAVLGQQNDGRLFLRQVPAKLAAHEQGLRPGDEILLIDGKDVRGMTPEEVHRHLSGDIGAPVKLTLVRGDDVIRATLARTPATRDPRSGTR